ncbi:MAG: DUF3316 domain-containing protein [Dysgonamonadaceae bacterium]|nr:DUF3316 domain-containing protein [Dysgonamonadaceae bacterium]
MLITSAAAAYPQEKDALTLQSSMVGWGIGKVYDTYLSPLDYSGKNVAVYSEQLKATGMASGKIIAQTQYSINYSWSKNKAETASYYTGLFDYNYGMFYKFSPAPKLRIFAGTQAGCLLGFIYNNRNGNNPAAGKFHLNLNLSAIASYEMKIKSLPLRFGYQISLPFAGIMYSPDFGQSYYEISLGDDSQLAYLSSFHNYLAVKNILTVDVPLKSFTLKLGYVHSYYETQINSLDSRISSGTFCVGVAKNFLIVPTKKIKNYRYVFE